MKSLNQRIKEKFKICPVCKGACMNLKTHMKMHCIKKEMTYSHTLKGRVSYEATKPKGI